jgi:hypothetical protein
MEFLGFLVCGVIVLCLIAAVFFIQAKKDAARAEAMRSRGWRYIKGTRGFEIVPKEGVPWSLTLVKNKGKSQSQSATTSWQVPARSSGVVLVGPKLPSALANMNFGGSMAQFLLRALLGEDAGDLADIKEMQTGSFALQERFTVLAETQADADTFVTPALEEALLSTLDGTIILKWRDRLQVRLNRGVWKPQELVDLVEFGQRISRDHQV